MSFIACRLHILYSFNFKVYCLSALHVPLTLYNIYKVVTNRLTNSAKYMDIKHAQMLLNTNNFKQIRKCKRKHFNQGIISKGIGIVY